MQGKISDFKMRRRKLPQLILKNNGNVTKSMIEAGYSESYSKSRQKSVTKNNPEVIAATTQLVNRIDNEIDEVFNDLPNKRDAATYRDLIDAGDKLIKDKQLLTGKATDNHALQVNIIDYSKIPDDELLPEEPHTS